MEKPTKSDEVQGRELEAQSGKISATGHGRNGIIRDMQKDEKVTQHGQ